MPKGDRTDRKSKVNAPKVTSVVTTLSRDYVPGSENTRAATESETVQRKKKALEITDLMMDNIKKGLTDGTIQLTTSADIERVMKLMMLLSGEPDNIQGHTGSETITDTRIMAETNMSKIGEILDMNDPNVKAIYSKLFEGYNNINDA